MSAEKLMPPELKILFDQHKAETFATLNCVQIGKIEKVTASEQTVEISLQIRRLAEDGTSEAYPVLVDCPYFVLQGGGHISICRSRRATIALSFSMIEILITGGARRT